MPLTNGSGSWILDLDPAIFIIDLQDASPKLIFYHNFFCLLLFEGTSLFSKIKSQKESQNSSIQDFSYYFCMMIEGSGSGSIPLTCGSGSGRPKITWIRIRIRNAAYRSLSPSPLPKICSPKPTVSGSLAGKLQILFRFLNFGLLFVLFYCRRFPHSTVCSALKRFHIPSRSKWLGRS